MNYTQAKDLCVSRVKNLIMLKKIEKIRKGLKEYLINSNIKTLVIGVSGGIDSAIVCALAKPVADELNIELIGRLIEIEGNKRDEIVRSKNIGEAFCSDFKQIDLNYEYSKMEKIDTFIADKQFNKNFDFKKNNIRKGNIKARMRMIYLYNLASKTNGIVLGTENLTEHYLGFFTIGGDEISDIEMIKNLWKSEVYDMTEYIALNDSNEKEKKSLMSCIYCDATDGLGISSTDLDQILPDWKNRHNNTRSGYNEVDNIFKSYFNFLEKINKTISPYEKNELITLINNIKKSPVIQRYIKTDFKRKRPYICQIN